MIQYLKKRCQEESNTHLKKLNHFWKYEFFYLYLYVKGKVLLSWLLIGVIFRFINFFLCSANKPQELAIVMVLNVLSSFKIEKKGLLIEWNNKWQYAYIIYSTQSLAFRSDMTKTEIYLLKKSLFFLNMTSKYNIPTFYQAFVMCSFLNITLFTNQILIKKGFNIFFF